MFNSVFHVIKLCEARNVHLVPVEYAGKRLGVVVNIPMDGYMDDFLIPRVLFEEELAALKHKIRVERSWRTIDGIWMRGLAPSDGWAKLLGKEGDLLVGSDDVEKEAAELRPLIVKVLRAEGIIEPESSF